MWTYSTDAVASQAFGAPSMQQVTGITVDGQEYNDKYIFNGEQPVLENGRLALGGVKIDGELMRPDVVIAGGDTIVDGGRLVVADGVEKVNPHGGLIAEAGVKLVVDGREMIVSGRAEAVSALTVALAEEGTSLTLAHIAKLDANTGRYILEETSPVPAASGEISVNYKTVLNPATKAYQSAGDWNGNLLAIQAIAAVLWAVVLAGFRRRKLGYSLSLLIGAAGFVSVFFIHNQYVLGISYALMGCA